MDPKKGQRYSNEFRRDAVSECAGATTSSGSRESWAYVAEFSTTGVINWTKICLLYAGREVNGDNGCARRNEHVPSKGRFQIHLGICSLCRVRPNLRHLDLLCDSFLIGQSLAEGALVARNGWSDWIGESPLSREAGSAGGTHYSRRGGSLFDELGVSFGRDM